MPHTLGPSLRYNVILRACMYLSFLVLTSSLSAQLSGPELLYQGHAPIGFVQVADFNDDDLVDLFISRLGQTAPASHTYYGGLYWYAASDEGDGHAYESQKIVDGTYDKLWLIDYDHDSDLDILARDRRATGTHPTAGYIYARNNDGIFTADEPPAFLRDSFYAVQTVADINGDLIDDILYRKQFSPATLFVAAGLGDGTFSHAPLFTAAGEFLLADINQDGLKDFVMSDMDSDALYYYASSGILAYDTTLLDSQFQSSETLVTVGEFTGSGELEVLYHHIFRDSLYLITQLNSGNPQHRPLVYSAVSAVSSADFNADGAMDLYLQGEAAPIFLNDGAGQFDQSPALLQDGGVVIFSDVDIDARQSTHYFQNNLASILEFDNGVYTETQPRLPDLHFGSIDDVETGDINSDSLVDVMLSSRWGHAVAYLPGLPYKKLGLPQEVAYDEEGANNHQLVDVDGDANVDVVYSSIWDGDISVKFGDGQGGFCCKETVVKDWGLIWSSASADFTGDGLPDIVAYSSTAEQCVILRNDSGVFEDPEVIDIISSASDLRAVDIDADTDLDILVETINGQGIPIVVMALNDGTGHFDALRTVFVGAAHSYLDFDGDGFDEIVSYDNVFKYNGNSYTEWFSGSLPLSGQDPYMYLDYNGDTYLDLLLQDNETGVVSLYRNRENQEFVYDDVLHEKLGIELPPLTRADQYSLDLDGDNDLDLLYLHAGNLYRLTRVTGDRTLRGTTFWDQNTDTTHNANEPGIDNMTVRVRGPAGQSLATISRQGGLFEVPVDTGWHTIEVNPASDCWKSLDPEPLEVYVTDDGADPVDLAFTQVGDETALSASLSRAATRCGFQVRYYFKLHNTGCATIFGNLRVTLDPRITSISEVSLEQYQISDNVIELPLDTLLAGEAISFNALTGIPGVAFIGEILRDQVFFAYDDVDGSILDQLYQREFSSEITCAYDPNDKVVSPDRRFLYATSYVTDEEILFTIRFQNTGNDTAFNVMLSDTLSPMLDISTIRVMDASHANRLVIDEESRNLSIFFDDIFLPDSNVNQLGSNGFFTFSIKPVDGLEDFTPIENSAAIFFDFNPPIITNTVQLEYVSDLALVGTREFKRQEILLIPNPSTGHFLVDTEQPVDKVLMYSANGQKVYEATGQQQIDAGHLLGGLYYVMIYSGGTTMAGRIVILH